MEDGIEEHIGRFWAMEATDLPEKLVNLQTCLRLWVKPKASNRSINRDNLQKRLDKLLEEDLNEAALEEIVNVKLALNMEADKEELYWE